MPLGVEHLCIKVVGLISRPRAWKKLASWREISPAPLDNLRTIVRGIVRGDKRTIVRGRATAVTQQNLTFVARGNYKVLPLCPNMSDLIISRVNSDQQLIAMWLHGRSSGTQSEYQRDVRSLFDFLGKPLQSITLEDLQSYASHLNTQSLKEATKRRKINSVKSLFSFATKLNYIRFNVAAALRIPKGNSILAGRIMKQIEVFKLLDRGNLEPRDRAFLKLLYATGMRVSEALGLVWDNFSERDSGEVQVKILGKGHKLRVVLVPLPVWMEVETLRGNASGDTPVFTSCRGRPLDRTMAHRIVKEAVTAAGLDPKISAHWLRHAHAQHALAKGAPIHLVRDSLGHSNISVTNVYLESNPTDSSSKYLGL